MNTVTFARTHYIYEVDNIPDHRSRRFGCCPCQMAVRRSDRLPKKAVSGRQPKYGRCKMNRFVNNSICPIIISSSQIQSKTMQLIKGSSHSQIHSSLS